MRIGWNSWRVCSRYGLNLHRITWHIDFGSGWGVQARPSLEDWLTWHINSLEWHWLDLYIHSIQNQHLLPSSEPKTQSSRAPYPGSQADFASNLDLLMRFRTRNESQRALEITKIRFQKRKIKSSSLFFDFRQNFNLIYRNMRCLLVASCVRLFVFRSSRSSSSTSSPITKM